MDSEIIVQYLFSEDILFSCGVILDLFKNAALLLSDHIMYDLNLSR
jgi:hypothetical protein